MMQSVQGPVSLGQSVVNCELLRRDLNLNIFRGLLKEQNVGTSESSSAFQNCAGESEQCATNIFITAMTQLNTSLLITSQSKWTQRVIWTWSCNKQHLHQHVNWDGLRLTPTPCCFFDHLDKRNSSSGGLKTCLPFMYTSLQHWQISCVAQDTGFSKSGMVVLTTS